MPINFPSIPAHIQVNLTQKLDAVDFASFQQSSQQANTTAKYLKTAISVPKDLTKQVVFDIVKGKVKISFGLPFVYDSTEFGRRIELEKLSGFRFDAIFMTIRAELNDDFCRSLIDFFHKSGSRAIYFCLEKEAHVSCSPELFTVLLKLVSAKIIRAYKTGISSAYFRKLPTNIEDLFAITEMTNEDFINLKCPHIDLSDTQISSSGINQVLKEWYERNRKIVYLYVHTDKEIVKDQIFSGMDHMEIEEEEDFEIDNGSEVLKVSIYPMYGHVQAEIVQKNVWDYTEVE